MNSSDRKLLSTFISQRMEMGEAVWFFKPDLHFMNGSNRSKVQLSMQENIPAHVVTKEIKLHNLHAPEPEPYTGETSNEKYLAMKQSLDELYMTVCNCKRCPLGYTRNKFVFGSGNVLADIMFIGEAPGGDEDREGLPFVGRAGKLLTRMIEAMKLHREDVYIGNILKCHPPGNRDPKPDEIEKCEPILIEQIEIIKPEIICALGRVSGQTMLRTKSPLTVLRGKIHDYHGVKLIVTYHPAALLRNKRLKPAAWEDLKFLRREYDGMEL